MRKAIADFLPFAVGVAISPIPIVAAILMLFTERARQNGVAFMAGWIAGIAADLAILVAIASTRDLSTEGPSHTVAWIELVLGLLLLIAAVRQWRKRPPPGATAPMPGWMTRIDTLKPGAALGLGLLLSAANPKNLLLMAGGAIAITQADLGSTDSVIAVAIFTVIGSCTVVIPTLAYLVMGSKVQPKLDNAKAWLWANNTAVMAVLLLVFGVSLIGKGIGTLT